jgi:hypothetical protein
MPLIQVSASDEESVWSIVAELNQQESDRAAGIRSTIACRFISPSAMQRANKAERSRRQIGQGDDEEAEKKNGPARGSGPSVA